MTAAAAAGFYISYRISSFVKSPLDISAPKKVLFVVRPGQNLNSIASSLEKESIIKNRKWFVVYARLKKLAKHIQAGEYDLSASQPPEQILDILIKGRVRLYSITFPEGLNMKEMASLIEGSGYCSADQFLGICHDRSFIKSLCIDEKNLEGYLFPDTYSFARQTPCTKIVKTMTEKFKTVFDEEWAKKSVNMTLSAHEAVTLASIIEKETGDASERALISSVFHNRLKKNMRLASDPTVIYGIKDFDGNIKKKHLTMDTPYNTYRIRGLPPGPIASPGRMSIRAALNPAETSYLYFVSKNDGTHKFSKNIQEHNQAVRQYQLKK